MNSVSSVTFKFVSSNKILRASSKDVIPGVIPFQQGDWQEGWARKSLSQLERSGVGIGVPTGWLLQALKNMLDINKI
jgi:hypothetical protein